MLFTLIAGNLLSRKMRTLLTALSIAVSVALVVAVTSGVSAFQRAAMESMTGFMNAVDATVNRQSDGTRSLPESIATDLESDPAVQLVMPRLESEVALGGPQNSMLPSRVTLVGTDRSRDRLLDVMRMDDGRWFAQNEPACVIDQGLAAREKLKVGDTFRLKGTRGDLALPIVGIVHKPSVFAGLDLTAYAPLPEVQTFFFGTDNPHRITDIRLQIKPGTNIEAWRDRVEASLKERDSQLRLRLTRQIRDRADRNFLLLRLLTMLAGAVTMVSAMFIIISTLSIGVIERQRTLAMLRAIGASKWQVARLIVGEGAGLGLIGALIGVPLGFIGSVITVLILRKWFNVSPALDWLGVAGATLASLAAASLASAFPAWQATRVDPLEAMAPLALPARRGPPWLAGAIGLMLVLVDPFLLYLPWIGPYTQRVQFYSHFILGLPCLMVGFYLLAPIFVWSIGRIVGPVAAVLLRVPYSIVRQQLEGGLWRLAGTCAALMVGLAVLVVMQVQGNSSLASWRLPDRFPDVFIFTRSLNGLSPEQQRKLADSSVFKRDDVMPIATFAPAVGGGLFGLVTSRAVGATMFVAVDPDKAFRLMELDFRQGSADEATRLLKQGGYLLVTDEMARMRNLNLGDTLPLTSLTRGTVNFKVAGVVSSPGFDVMVNSYDMGKQFEQQTTACVFGSLADAEKEFGVTSVFLMCANFADFGTNKEMVTEQLRTELGDASITVADVRQLKARIQRTMRNLLLAASIIAWGALLVASLGVTNTVIAGIRSRSWQFGVLRSIGLLGNVLMRMVLVEALVLGIVGATMGLLCGLFMTIDGRRLMQLTIGHLAPIVIPWPVVSLGIASVIGVSLLASLVPAIRLARTDPLTLLQVGRSGG